MTEWGRVAVLMGGQSAERAISLQSGRAVARALHESKIDAVAYDFNPQTAADFLGSGFDCAFIAMHGRGGEDGSLQGMLDLLRMPYSGSGVLASALAMDKHITKKLWLAQGLPTPPFVVVDAHTTAAHIAMHIDLPIALKPNCEGSSIGISKVERWEDLAAARDLALQCSPTALAEAWIAGDEYAVALLDDQILPPIRLQTARPFYDYTAKYHDAATRYHCPCGLPAATLARLKTLCWNACRALGVCGWGRVDVIRDTAAQFWLLEVNTVPGLTTHSLVPMAAAAAGIDFRQLVLNILGTARERVQ